MAYSMQEAFTIVENHLLTQQEKSTENDKCKYHYNGLKCAVGCLISEEDYEYTLENIPVSNLPEPLLEKLIGKDWETLDMLTDLQDVHDCRHIDSWRDCLDEVASKYNVKTCLTYNTLQLS